LSVSKNYSIDFSQNLVKRWHNDVPRKNPVDFGSNLYHVTLQVQLQLTFRVTTAGLCYG